MKNPLTFRQLQELASSHPPIESFGPFSDRPYIAFNLEDSEAQLCGWLKDVPCPVIGIGRGVLEDACDVVLETERKLPLIAANITQAPLAAMVLVQHLRASETLSATDALTAESFAYAAIQAGPEFQKWLSQYERQPLATSSGPILDIDVNSDNEMSLVLNSPETHNAIGTEMRDALCNALDLALAADMPKVVLTGNGAAFSTGGAIEEFGGTPDPATAHWVRTLRLPAWRFARLENRLRIHVNGAAIGAGVEIAAFGHHVTASSKAWFQLPELKYGLIPGAGGTVSLPRRIGRQKTAFMALSMEKIRAEAALKWGLIDEIID
ncbi:enoyl-CoA hydratase/isomerase family protein [Hellea balneolensis]|uniref:enoyl-CoA hydratase/isomerase family protein n=1 Tax=Hellea balneolensis TaxID=287478 RepID=UPI00040C30CB|nr:enoyl-CoA hydratase/isomerase family protein [Hellea balneolensis]